MMKKGEVLAYIRRHLHNGIGKKFLSQTGFYKACLQTEAGVPENDRVLKIYSNDYTVVKVVGWEKRSEISEAEQVLIEAFLEVPDGFLDGSYQGPADLEAAYTRRRVRSLKKKTLPAMKVREGDATWIPPDPDRFFMVLPERLFLGERREKLTHYMGRQLNPDAKQQSSLVFLTGAAALGKSLIVSYWWSNCGRTKFGDIAFAIDCSAKSLDLVTRELTFYLTGSATERVDARTTAYLRSCAPALFVFDQLRYSGRSRENRPQAGTSYEQAVGLCAELCATGAKLRFILVVQDDEGQFDDATARRRLPSSAISTLVLSPLSEDEGLAFLRFHGVLPRDVPDQHLRDLTKSLLGIPMCLYGAAAQLRGLDAAGKEAYIADLRMSETAEPVANFLDRYLRSLSDEGENDNLHPLAFLRLLALMVGPTSIFTLQEIVRTASVRRLRDLRDQVPPGAHPFVVARENTFDLHAMVRSHIRGELARICSGIKDPHANREELLRIHSCAAKIYRFEFDGVQAITKMHQVAALEGFVWHLIRFRDLLGAERQHRERLPEVRDDALSPQEAALVEELLPGATRPSTYIAAAETLTEFAFKHVVIPYLLDVGLTATRVLGRFHTKARILMFFIDRHDLRNGLARWLSSSDQLQLFAEIALCWLHNGSLNLSFDAINRANSLVSGRHQPVRSLKSNSIIDANSSKRDREAWAVQVRILAVETIIYIRQGRSINIVRDKIARHLATIQAVEKAAAVGACGDADALTAQNVVKATVKLKTRLAHLAYLSGDLETSIRTFEEATRLQLQLRTKRPSEHLNGEAARLFVAALLKGGHSSKMRAVHAQAIIDSNIAFYEKAISTAGRIRNDIIPFRVCQAAAFRMAGDFAAAENELEGLSTHPYLLQGECTFQSGVEYRIEKIRLRLTRGKRDIYTQTEARELRQMLDARHHLFIAAEVALLEAEAQENPRQRADLINIAETQFSPQGIGLWKDDIELLRAGRWPHSQALTYQV